MISGDIYDVENSEADKVLALVGKTKIIQLKSGDSINPNCIESIKTYKCEPLDSRFDCIKHLITKEKKDEKSNSGRELVR